MKSAGRRMPEWASRNTVWGRGKGPIPGCPVEDKTPPPEPADAPEPPEPFTRVPEPDAGL